MGLMKGAPRSKEFDDVYFSAEDGLAETRHVFLEHNNLPAAWQGTAGGGGEFVIAETGFGTGLNFLSVWKLFEETAAPGLALEFISFEKYPLRGEEIAAALSVWEEVLAPYTRGLCAVYPKQKQGVHGLKIAENVTLRLVFGDVNVEMPKLQALVDCWFLDGFKPSSNPEMWSDIVFANMARMSRPGASFATFTAAGFVKRGLAAAGFEVAKVRGFGRKREMLVGHYRGEKP